MAAVQFVDFQSPERSMFSVEGQPARREETSETGVTHNSTLGRETATSGIAHGQDWSAKIRRSQKPASTNVPETSAVPDAAPAKEKFSFGRALKSVGRGVVQGFKNIVDAFRERPISSAATFAGMVGFAIAFPGVMEIAVPVLALGVSGYQAIASIVRAVKAESPRDAEKELAGVGEALAGVGLMASGLVLSRFLHMLKHAAVLHLLDDAPVVLSLISKIFGSEKSEQVTS